MSDERILVVERASIPGKWLPEFGTVPLTKNLFITEADSFPMTFLSRAEMEKNPRYKQIIPYLIIRDSAGRILCYRRKGSERRLHDLYSVGIGGHVNERMDKTDTIWKSILRGLLRETKEETALQLQTECLNFYGIINEEKTKVGRVHLGLVFAAQLTDWEKANIKASSELIHYSFCFIHDFLTNKQHEYWSALALRLITNRKSA